MKKYRFWDIEICDRNFRRFYLRHKLEMRTGFVVVTVRNQKNGKGVAIAQVRGLMSDSQRGEIWRLYPLYKRLAGRWRKDWYFVARTHWADLFLEGGDLTLE